MSDSPSSRPALLPVQDPDLLGYLEHRIARTAEEFGVDPSGFPRPVLIIERPDGSPETRRLKDGACLIFITTTSDWHRARYQVAHEVVHNVLSTTVEPVFDWIQEMFAVHVAVRAMRELGEYRYVGQTEAGLWEEARLMSREQMLGLDLQPPYPAGIYGQSFVAGCELNDQIGWERLKLLGTQINEGGRHDVAAWLRLLNERERESVERVMGATGNLTWQGGANLAPSQCQF